MSVRLPVTIFLGLLLSVPVWAADPGDIQHKADQGAERVSDAQAFVEEIDRSLEMAREGVYGKIKDADMTRMKDARDTIATLLQGHERATQLPADQRIELYNAQELITSIIRDDDKNRKVCERLKEIGTRITKRECLTVAERERRSRDAKEAAADMLRLDCVVNDVNPCGIIRGSGNSGT